MQAYVVKRLATMVLVVLGISFAVFLVAHLIPGDPARILLGIHADRQQIDEIRRQLGLDRPLLVQYGYWISRALHGDLGRSVLTGEQVTSALAARLPVTCSLALGALLIALVIALPAGIVAAIRPNSWYGALITVASQIGVAIPDFWLGIMLILACSLTLGWLPSFGYVSIRESVGEWVRHLILPAMSIGWISGSIVTRFVRSAVLEVLGEDYVCVARAKGLRERVVILRHTVRNALITIVTVVGLQLASLLSGVVVIEVVFALPGLGRLAYDAVTRRDYPMLQGAVLTVALAFAVINLLVDLLYVYIDPRVKY